MTPKTISKIPDLYYFLQILLGDKNAIYLCSKIISTLCNYKAIICKWFIFAKTFYINAQLIEDNLLIDHECYSF